MTGPRLMATTDRPEPMRPRGSKRNDRHRVPREHLTDKGTPKRKLNRIPAQNLAARIPDMHAYHCAWCGSWHVGFSRGTSHGVDGL